LDAAERIWYTANPVYFNIESRTLYSGSHDVLQASGATKTGALYSSYFDVERKASSYDIPVSAGFALKVCGGSYSDLEGKYATVSTTITVPAKPAEYYLNIDSRLDNQQYDTGILGCTFNVDIDGVRVATNVTDYYGVPFAAGTSYQVSGFSSPEDKCYSGESIYSGTLNSSVSIYPSWLSIIRIYNGTSWGKYRVAIHNGTNWEFFRPIIYDSGWNNS
jgi:hypothetical protein